MNTIKRLTAVLFAFLMITARLCPAAVHADAGNLSGSHEVSDGTYMIVSGNSDHMVVDINNSSMENAGNAELFNKNNTLNQRYFIRYEGGYYTIMCIHSGKYLHVEDGSKTQGNVHQWEGNKHANAQWELIPAGNGYYYLRNKSTGSYLDNCGGSTTPGNNLIYYPFNGSNAQKWKFEPVDNTYCLNLNDNYFKIASANSSDLILDVHGSNRDNGANLEVFSNNNTANERFYLRYENGYYTIMAVHSGKYIHGEDENKVVANAHMWTGNKHDNARWIVIPVGDGYCYLQNKATGSYLDNSGGNAKRGNNVILHPFNGSAAQKWKFLKTSANGGPTLDPETYSYKRVTFDCSSLDNWVSSVKSTGYKVTSNSGVVVAVSILSYDTLTCQIPKQGPYQNENDRPTVTR